MTYDYDGTKNGTKNKGSAEMKIAVPILRVWEDVAGQVRSFYILCNKKKTHIS